MWVASSPEEPSSEELADPRVQLLEQVKLMPIPVIGLAPQPTLEDADLLGVSSVYTGSGPDSDPDANEAMTVSVSYTLWRKPDNRADPVNLALVQAEIDTSEVPKWLADYTERMRYPQLWEAVRTHWHRETSAFTSVPALLAAHVNYVLVNQYRNELWPGSDPLEVLPLTVTERAVNEDVSVTVDGIVVAGAEIDTDPFVYGIGAKLASGGVVTAVIPRDALQYVNVEFVTRP